MTETLTESERLVVVALARLQPTALRDLASECGFRSAKWTLDLVNRLRRRGLIADPQIARQRHWGRTHRPARSVRLADGIVVSDKGHIGRFIEVT